MTADSSPPIVALVLAGGIGSRLYPASRSTRPKQFLPLSPTASGSLLEETVARATFADHVVVSTRSQFESQVRDRLPDVEVVVEPVGKDTGPALAYATHAIGRSHGDCVVVALPSDHHVASTEAFAATMRRGARLAATDDRLVAFGVTPSRPDTGYGYIEPGTDHGEWFDLAAFHEKPAADTAERYVEQGYLWNAGMFAWTPQVLLDAARDSPLAPLVDALDAGRVEEGFAAVDPTSIDYAVMERVEHAAVVPLDVGWDDLGSWDALKRLFTPDENGNVSVTVSSGTDDLDETQLQSLLVDSTENVVVSDGPHVSVVGCEGVAVVVWDDRVLVVPTEDAQRVRDVVSRLKTQGRF